MSPAHLRVLSVSLCQLREGSTGGRGGKTVANEKVLTGYLAWVFTEVDSVGLSDHNSIISTAQTS